jgi:hypothetical protein
MDNEGFKNQNSQHKIIKTITHLDYSGYVSEGGLNERVKQ